MKKLLILPLLGAVACAPVGPATDPGAMTVPAAFAAGASAPAGQVAPDLWWRDLNDAGLTALVERGLAQNLDIAAAYARIAQAQATARGTGLPVSGGLTASVTESGQDGATQRTDSAGLNATLMIDLFGGDFRAQESALAALRAAEYGAGTARLAYLSAITASYVNARYYQNAAALARESLSGRERTLAIVEDRNAQGLATALELAQAQAAVDSARASIPGLDQGFESSVLAIATLLAEPAAPLLADMRDDASQPRAPGSAAAGVPADLLVNRPDVAAARQDVIAALAEVGVAEADMLPAISLSGSVTLTDPGGWSMGPTITLPVLNQPALQAARDGAAARAEAAQIAWRAAVLAAVEDVQVAQSDLTHSRRILAAQEAAASSNAQAETLTEQAWNGGGVALSDLIAAQISTATAQSAAAGALRDATLAWVAVQVAAGRGWGAGDLAAADGQVRTPRPSTD